MEQLNPNLLGKLLCGDDLTIYSKDGYELKLLNHNLRYIFSNVGLEFYNIFSNLSTTELDRVEDNKSFSELVKIFLSIFTNAYKIEYKETLNDYQVYFDESNFTMINQQLLSHIFYLFRKMYYVPDKEDGKYDKMIAKDDKFKDILEEFKEFDAQVSKSKTHIVTIDSIVESIAVKHNSYNLINIWDLTIYQLMRSYYRINAVDNYSNVMLGIYTGNIDSEKIKHDEINWSSRI